MNKPPPMQVDGDPAPAQHSKGHVDSSDEDAFFPVVGIGASAGGLEAYGQLLSSLRPDTGMAYVLVQHLDPNHESRLVQLLARSTKMPVKEIAPGMPIERNHVYVIAPNTDLAIEDGEFRVTPRERRRTPHLPIDHFLRSLAEKRGSRSVAVVLSGTGADGTLGLAEIKATGGITFAQDETTARHPGMPHSAAESGNVDFVMPPEGIAARLGEIGSHPYYEENQGVGGDEEQYRKILGLVRATTRVDFAQYRESTIRRRILRRMALRSEKTLSDYARRLSQERGEVHALYHDLLINVTSFFRDPDLFEAFKEHVFPQVLAAKKDHEPVRIWVAGCSTGQEAYSIAISLLEFLDGQERRPQIQIFATDLSDQNALDRARAGRYPESIEAEVSPERLRRFFRREDHVYRVDKTIRDMCVFARQNIAADPPFSHLDLISCRNVLIYLASPLQRRVLPTFHYALNPQGFLVLGSAETVGDHVDLFEPVDRTNKIYLKKATASRPAITFPADEFRTLPSVARRDRTAGPPQNEYQREVDRLLLGRFSPAGVLVNEDFDVLQYRGRTAPYLEVPAGEPTTSVLKMAREGLFLELRSALAEARQSRREVRREGLRVRDPESVREIDLEVLPIIPHGGGADCFLVLFHDRREGAAPAQRREEPAENRDDELTRVRQELVATKDYLQSMVEQQDAANEELRSANEEILSSNEELQSTNEELETAKEELQSANEELTTVNEQLQHRNLELTQSNNDFSNLLSSTSIPLVMVGADLRVRLFTPPARAVLNLLPADIGRPIGNIKPAVPIPDLEELIEQVIRTVQPVQKEVRDREGVWQDLRIYPYRTADHRIDGAVIVLVDIHAIKSAEEALREADRHKDEFLAIIAHELRNPIAPIRNAIEIVRIAADNPATLAQAHEMLSRQVRQLARIVEDLIDVSRIAEGKIELKSRRIDLAEAVESAIDLSREYLESCRHRLDVLITHEPMPIDADPLRISQIVVNLLNNAAKFTESGGHIEVELERSAGPGNAPGEAVLRVRDSGRGIAPEFLPHVFEMFRQEAKVLDARRSGLGVGLALVASLVRMHGGRIEVRSPGAGQGSEFTVRLPLAAGPAPSESRPGAPFVLQPGGHPRRVLVVDDNVDQAMSLATLLKLLGHEVRMAHDGASALELAREFHPQIALVDLGMPGLNGYDLARSIREDASLSGMFLVAQTGWGQAEDRQRSKAAGFDEHLVKPLRPEDLQRVLETRIAAG
jgi:two-component system CheB/CheR fusion protein